MKWFSLPKGFQPSLPLCFFTVEKISMPKNCLKVKTIPTVVHRLAA